MKSRHRSRQAEIIFRAHGGARRGAGRKPKGERAGVAHTTRPELSGREPVLLTLKMQRRVWCLRSRRAFSRMWPAIVAAAERLGTRLVHCSVQRDHLHLIAEASDKESLSRAVQGLCVRLARALNRLMGTTGSVFADRYHSRVLRTPRQVRNALAYVLCNAAKHGCAPRATGPSGTVWLDPFSTAASFDGWLDGPRGSPHVLRLAAPRTWLLAIGWRRAGGALDPRHRPGSDLD